MVIQVTRTHLPGKWATMGATAHLVDRVADSYLWTVCGSTRKQGYPTARVLGINESWVNRCERCRIAHDRRRNGDTVERNRRARGKYRTRRGTPPVDPAPTKLTPKQVRALERDARVRGVLGM